MTGLTSEAIIRAKAVAERLGRLADAEANERRRMNAARREVREMARIDEQVRTEIAQEVIRLNPWIEPAALEEEVNRIFWRISGTD